MTTNHLFVNRKISPLFPFISFNGFLLFFLGLFFHLFLSSQAHAFSLEDITIKSSFGEKFHAEIVVKNDSRKGVKVSIGTEQEYALLNAKRQKLVDQLHIVEPLEVVSFNKQLITIVSHKPLFYPSFELIIKATLDEGTILEKYSLSVDFKKNMTLALSPKKEPEKTATPKLDFQKPPKLKTVEKPEKLEKPEEPIKIIEPEKTEELVKIIEPVKIKAAKKIKEPKIIEEVKKLVATKKIEPTTKKIPEEKFITYRVKSGDTLTGILRKEIPQKFNLYRAVVALWRLNKNKFHHNNMNALKVGSELSFANLDEEMSKISGKETEQILRQQLEEWRNIVAEPSVDFVSSSVFELPLPGENLLGTDEITRIINEWKESWKNKDMEKHFSYYSKNFLSENYLDKNIDLAGWKKYISRLTKDNSGISIDIKRVHIRKEGGKVIVSFLQKFSSDRFVSFGDKTIAFEKKSDEWKINHELFKISENEKLNAIGQIYPYVVHTSSHINRTKALIAANRLKKAGYSAYIAKSLIPQKGQWHRVLVDRFRTKKAAYLLAYKLVGDKISDYARVIKLPFAISLGSYEKEEEAYEILKSFRKKNYSPYLFSSGEENEITHHVLIGSYRSKEQAQEVSDMLVENGVAHKVFRP